ncbi:MAG: MauE/DoxX family redox-associated membrane protein [Desulfobacterales bacterium]
MGVEHRGPHGGSAGRWVRLAARWVLGAVFVYASLDKIAHPAAFARDVYNYQILPDALVHAVALVLPWLELFVGACLITGFWFPGAVLTANGLLVVFVGALAFNAARGLDVHCGCFSTGGEGPAMAMHWVLLRDGLFLAVALVLFQGVFFGRPRSAGKVALLLCAVCWLAAGTGAAAETGLPEAFLPQPHHDFGTAIEGDIVRHEFVVQNRGAGELRIEKIKTG